MEPWARGVQTPGPGARLSEALQAASAALHWSRGPASGCGRQPPAVAAFPPAALTAFGEPCSDMEDQGPVPSVCLLQVLCSDSQWRYLFSQKMVENVAKKKLGTHSY